MSVYMPTSEGPHGAVGHLAEHPSKELAEHIVNTLLNNFIGANNEDDVLRYHGWWWRDVDFFAPRGVTVAEGDGQVAVCQNNKWGYDSRDLTPEEQELFLSLIWDAYLASRSGGVLSDIIASVQAKLGAANAFIESLAVSA